MDLEELENGNEPKLPEFKLGMNVIPSLTNYSHSSPFERYVNRQADKFWNNGRQEQDSENGCSIMPVSSNFKLDAQRITMSVQKRSFALIYKCS